MMSDQLYITAEGAEKLKAELGQLKGPGRDDISKRLRAAIQMGDLSENADYHKAKEDQAFLEGRIQELEYLLKNAIIVEAKDGKHEVVDIGAQVTVREQDYEPETYTLVGVKEADPRNGKISNQSPIGQALMGKRVGERVHVETPDGEISLEILDIE
jgi:transcription elongation factor GreA